MAQRSASFTLIPLGIAVLLSLSACTIGDGEGSIQVEPEDNLSASESPEGEEAAPLEEGNFTEWAEQVIATSVSDDVFTTLSGHLDPDSALQSSSTDASLAPGSYTYHFACRGEGNIEFTAGSAGMALFEVDGPCTGEDLQGPFVTTETGATITAVSQGTPLDWAFKLTKPRKG